MENLVRHLVSHVFCVHPRREHEAQEDGGPCFVEGDDAAVLFVPGRSVEEQRVEVEITGWGIAPGFDLLLDPETSLVVASRGSAVVEEERPRVDETSVRFEDLIGTREKLCICVHENRPLVGRGEEGKWLLSPPAAGQVMICFGKPFEKVDEGDVGLQTLKKVTMLRYQVFVARVSNFDGCLGVMYAAEAPDEMGSQMKVL